MTSRSSPPDFPGAASSRRPGRSGRSAVVAPLLGGGLQALAAEAGPTRSAAADPTATPRVNGLHIAGQRPDRLPAEERDADADPHRDPDRRRRHHRRDRAHGHRRRWHLRSVQRALLHPAGLPGDHRGGTVRPHARPAPPIYVQEPAPWSAVRDAAHSYGFAAFRVDPGDQPGGLTKPEVTYYDVVGVEGQLARFESFTLQRPSAGRHPRLTTADSRGSWWLPLDTADRRLHPGPADVSAARASLPG